MDSHSILHKNLKASIQDLFFFWCLVVKAISGVEDSVIAFGQPWGRGALNQSCAPKPGEAYRDKLKVLVARLEEKNVTEVPW